VRWRLIAVLAGLTVMVLAVHDIPLAAHLRDVERDRIVTSLERDAFTLAGRAEEALEKSLATEYPALREVVEGYRERTGARVLLLDRNGLSVITSDPEVSDGRDYSTRPEVSAALAGNPVTGERDSRDLGGRLLYVAVPILSGTEVVGAVRLTYPARVVADRVEDRVRGLVVVAAISILTATVVAVLLANTVTSPLRRLRTVTEQVANGDLAIRADETEGPGEVRSLASSFNTMAERLHGLLDSQRSFASSASHQLRTPLTALRLRLDQASELLDDDPDAARARLDLAAAETDRLQRLIDGLLVLARAEGADHVLVVVDLAALARSRVEMWEPLAEERGVRLAWSGPTVAQAIAVAGAADQIIDNFVDNALDVAPPDSTIELTVEARASGVEVRVRDRGPGLSELQISRAFDRFWRGADAPAGGSGLGLAIVAQLARASKATVRLERRPGGGLDAVAMFAPPLPQPRSATAGESPTDLG
jgi:signal transduction histidine kinase